MSALATTVPPHYVTARSVSEALEFAAQQGEDFSYLAGGTDVLVNFRQGTVQPACLIDITGIQTLREVAVEDRTLRIGPLVRLDELHTLPEIATHFPVLIEAAEAVGSPLVRKTATIGGNILCENRCRFFNQSTFWRDAVNHCLKSGGDFCLATGGTKACFSRFVSDMAAALIALNAVLEIHDIDGSSTTPLEDIYTGDGIQPRKLSKTALVGSIILPLDQGFRTVFKKLSPRKSVDFTSLTTAVSVNHDGMVKIAISGVSPKPVVVTASVDTPLENLIRQALKQAKSVDNDVYSRTYRREMLKLFLNESFAELGIG